MTFYVLFSKTSRKACKKSSDETVNIYIVVGDSPMTRKMDLSQENIKQELEEQP